MAIKDLTRDVIADVTYNFLLKKPITKLTMTEIAASCGISKPTLYRYFYDKYEIARYLVEQIDAEFYNKHSYAAILNEKTPEKSFYIFKHEDFFKNVLCYEGQNSIFDCLAEITLEHCKKEFRRVLGTDNVSDDLMAAAEYYSYSVWHGMYAMMSRKISQRYLKAETPAMTLYWPPLLTEVFSNNLSETRRKQLIGVED